MVSHVPAVLRGARWEALSDWEELLHGAIAAGPGNSEEGMGRLGGEVSHKLLIPDPPFCHLPPEGIVLSFSFI